MLDWLTSFGVIAGVMTLSWTAKVSSDRRDSTCRIPFSLCQDLWRCRCVSRCRLSRTLCKGLGPSASQSAAAGQLASMEAAGDSSVCGIRLDEPADMMFQPCSHCMTCAACMQLVMKALVTRERLVALACALCPASSGMTLQYLQGCQFAKLAHQQAWKRVFVLPTQIRSCSQTSQVLCTMLECCRLVVSASCSEHDLIV